MAPRNYGSPQCVGIYKATRPYKLNYQPSIPNNQYRYTAMPTPPPEHLLEIKREIVESYGPDFQERATKAWGEILAEMASVTKTIGESGSNVSSVSNLAHLEIL
jgi:hypothetical protein